MSVLNRILHASQHRTRRQLEAVAAAVAGWEPDMAALDDTALAAKTDEFRDRLADGETLDDLLLEAFAVVREASRRVLGMRHFDVQVMGGVALYRGAVAEMGTGEGKTLVATLPAYLHALTGDGVHIVTVNDYLATRDAAHTGRIHEFLGLRVDVVTAGLTPDQRRRAYAADITYATNNELGFDYLRDNMATSLDGCVQRALNFAIVDEVDSILIDEARTPLIISTESTEDLTWYHAFARLAELLVRDRDYVVDEKRHKVGVTDAGIAAVEDQLGAEHLYLPENAILIRHLNQALRAKELYRRDRDYIVRGGRVEIVDEHTGRVLTGRRYSDGLHQALEAKEGVTVEAENPTEASITLQNFFRSYAKLAGMTGTAGTEAAELHGTYGLNVIPIPTNKPRKRIDAGDLIYRTEAAKFAAVADDIAQRHATGQPVLIGTTSVEKSELLSELLHSRGIAHQTLNAKQHGREADIVAQAGRVGAVTVATNMAGRGTDILLGGNADALAASTVAGLGLTADDDGYAEAYQVALATAKETVAADRAKVAGAGGLHVIGTERHDSRRIDGQLRGRAGRQGDPGSSRFFLSLEDEIVRKFSGNSLSRAMDVLGAGDTPIEVTMVSRAVDSAQSQQEARNYEIRKDIVKYDDVLSSQRAVIYTQRRRVLEGIDMGRELNALIDRLLQQLVSGIAVGYPEQWDLDGLFQSVEEYFGLTLTTEELLAGTGLSRESLTAPAVIDHLREQVMADYEQIKESFDSEQDFHDAAAVIMVRVTDHAWRAHLNDIDYLRSGIHLRSIAQSNPLVEYQREAYALFLAMLDTIRADTVGYLFGLLRRGIVPSTAEATDAA